MVARIFLADDGAIAVWGEWLNANAMPNGWTLLARYEEAAYPALHHELSLDTTRLSWNAVTSELSLDNVVKINAAWITARENELTTAQQTQTEDNSERATLLEQAAAALTQITNDKTAVGNGKTAANAATTLAQMRTIILGMLDVMEHTLNREERVIKTLRAVVRSGLDSG